MAGRNLAWLAAEHRVAVPDDLKRAKGWIGQLVELHLGATASTRPEPDFPHLGIELKTVPVDRGGRPAQSTYVCTVPLDRPAASWDASWVRKKLARVLWVPIVGSGPPGERILGAPVMWSPSEEEEAILQADWTELTDLIALGELWQVEGQRGQALQIRPKGARNVDRTWALDVDGRWVRDVPRGFYLRPRFTGAILARQLHARGAPTSDHQG